MAIDEKNRPIVIKRIKKTSAAQHGGTWKVAFADFMTAMFALFLILWLVSQLDDESRRGIAEYFRNPSPVYGPTGTPNVIDLDGGSAAPIDMGDMPNFPAGPEFDHLLRSHQMAQLEALQEVLEEAISQSQALEPFKDQLLLDITPEGLRIQLVDSENRPMFDLGSARLRSYAYRILVQLGRVINHVPNKISITGHTDARRFAHGTEEYTNWELSTDRANAARRALRGGGFQEERIAQVTGLSDTVLFDKEDPYNPVNRRISIIVLNPDAEAAISKRESYEPDW